MIRLVRSTLTAAYLVALAGFAAACREEDPLTGPSGAVAVASSALLATKDGFHLLPPLAPQPVPTGRFDPTLAPAVEVHALAHGACGAIIAAWTKSGGPRGEPLRVDTQREWYQVNWKTRESSLSDDVDYRIVVRLGAVELGHVDIGVGRHGAELRLLETGEVIALSADGTLTIRFRAEDGIADGFESVNTGKLVFVSDRSGTPHIYTMNGSGGDLQKLTSGSAASRYPEWSPDGTRIVYQRQAAGIFQHEIWVMGWDGSGKTDLSNININQLSDGSPVWSPDGSRIAFQRTFFDGNQSELFVMNADGTGQVNLSQDSVGNDWSASWSPDGTRIAFLKGSRPYVVLADGTGTPTALGPALAMASCGSDTPAWLPSGDQIAITVDCDIHLVEPDGSGLTNLSNGAGYDSRPQWAPDGSKLYFVRDVADGIFGPEEIWAMNPDGTCQHELVNTGLYGIHATFDIRSDGLRLAYPTGEGNTRGTWEIFRIHPDGTGETNLTNAEGADYAPDWRP